MYYLMVDGEVLEMQLHQDCSICSLVYLSYK